METFATMHDSGAQRSTEFGAASTTVDSEVNGSTYDRIDSQSCKMVVTYSAVLAQDETLTVAINPQHGAESDGSDAADYDRSGNDVSVVAATGGTGGSTETGTVELDVRTDSADQFVRGQVTCTTSAAGTCTWALTYVTGGLTSVAGA